MVFLPGQDDKTGCPFLDSLLVFVFYKLEREFPSEKAARVQARTHMVDMTCMVIRRFSTNRFKMKTDISKAKPFCRILGMSLLLEGLFVKAAHVGKRSSLS
jgi:hypothetical protein